MPHSRPMPSIGSGCHELRIRDETVSWRNFYRVDPDAIVIAEIIEKKTERTPQAVLATCRRRLRQYERDREES